MTKIVRRLDSSHDPYWGKGMRDFATKSEATAQRIRTRLLLIAGEYFLDTTEGTPWFQISEDADVRPIMGVPLDRGYAEAVLKARILGTDGIATIESVTMDFDPGTRHASIAAAGTDDDGNTFTVALQDPGP